MNDDVLTKDEAIACADDRYPDDGTLVTASVLKLLRSHEALRARLADTERERDEARADIAKARQWIHDVGESGVLVPAQQRDAAEARADAAERQVTQLRAAIKNAACRHFADVDAAPGLCVWCSNQSDQCPLTAALGDQEAPTEPAEED